jgi:hypothetical protein
METEKKTTGQTQTKTVKKRSLLKILMVVFVVIIGIALLIVAAAPMALSSSGGTRFLLGQINQSVDGQVGMDKLSVGWFSGVKLSNLTYESDDGATQVKVGRIETQPSYTALIGGRVDLGKTVIDTPQLYLKVSSVPERRPPASTPPTKSPSPKPAAPTGFVLPVHLMNLEVLAGNATIELVDADARTQRVTFKNIASTVVLNEAGQTSQLNVSLDVANGQEAGSVRAEGAVTPSTKGWTLEDTDGTFQVTITKLDLESLRPLVAMAGLDVQTGGVLNADANVQIRKGNIETLNAEARVTNFSQGVGEQKMVFSDPVELSLQGGMKDNTVRIDKLNVKAPFCTVACSGSTETLEYTVTAKLAETQNFVKQFSDLGGYGMAGDLDVKGRLNLGEKLISSAGKGTIKNLLLSKDGNNAPQTDVSLAYDAAMDSAKNAIKVNTATLEMLPGTVSIRNLSMSTDTMGTSPVNLEAQANLDLGKAWPYAQILGGAPADTSLAGMLNAAVSVETKADIMRVKTDATNITKLRVAKTGSTPFEQDAVKLTADVSLDIVRQSIGINTFDMQSSKGETLIKITKGKIEQTAADGVKSLDGQIEAEYDLKAVSSMAAAYMPEGLSVQGKRKDSFVFSSQWPESDPDKMMANLNGRANVGFEAAEYQGLKFGPTELSVNVKQGQAAIDIPDANVNGGKVRFAGDINLAEKPMTLKLRKASQVVENVKIDDVVSAKLLQYLNPVFANGTGVSGTANLSCSTMAIPLGGGTPKDINIAGNIGLTNVRLNSPILGLFKSALRKDGMDLFSIPSTAFTVKDEKVQYTDMPMTFGQNFALSFGGAIGLDKSLRMNVKVPVDNKTYVVPLSGTLDKPQPDFGSLVLSNITEQIPIKDEKTKEAVEKGLELLDGIFRQGDRR